QRPDRRVLEVRMIEISIDDGRQPRGGDRRGEAEERRRQPSYAFETLTGRAREDVAEDEAPEPHRRRPPGRAQIAEHRQHLAAVLLAERGRIHPEQRRVDAFGGHDLYDCDGSSPRFLAARTSSCSRRASSSTMDLPLR